MRLVRFSPRQSPRSRANSCSPGDYDVTAGHSCGPLDLRAAVKVVANGATGKFAGLVVPALVSHGIDVRAVVHEPGSKHIPLERGV